jgi:dolichyl-phosphate beta-glucosyltransferase
MGMTATEISIVVPAYNEEALIQSTLDGLRAYLLDRLEPFEIVVVDDGSQDRTVALVEAWQKSNGGLLKLVINPTNKGKGYSVHRGVQESCGRFIVFMDADLPYELGAIDDFLTALRSGHDLAVGSRVLPASSVRGVSAIRYLAGQVFSWLEQAVLATGLADTQCGFKAFNAVAAKEIFRRVTIDGFGFDVEMIYIARRLNYSIQTVAVQMIDRHRTSRVRLLEDSFKMFVNLFTVRWLDWQGKYK